MIFKLFESAPNISNDQIEVWNKSTDSVRSQMTDEIIKQYDKPGLENIRNAIFDNFDYFGINKKENPYIEFLDELEFSPSRREEPNFEYLNKYLISGKVDLSHDYLKMQSLYDRPLKDFEYTLNAFEIVMDKSELSKYFKDITNIDASQFIDPDTDEILPAGKPGDKGTNTIYGVIEQWSADDGNGNSNSVDSSNNELKYSLQAVLSYYKVLPRNYADVCKLWIKEYFAPASREVTPKENSSKFYIEKVSSILSEEKVRLTNARKDAIMKSKNYGTIEEIKPEERVEHNIIYLRELEHDSTGKNMFDNSVNTFMIYHNSQWIPYDEYATNIAQDERSILLNTKSVAILNDKSSAVAGIIRMIDKIVEEKAKSSDVHNYL